MWMVASIPHHPRTHAVGWVHPSRLMGASFPRYGCILPVGWAHSSRLMGASFPRHGRISPVGWVHAPAAWVHPSRGMGASFPRYGCILPAVWVHPSHGMDASTSQGHAPTSLGDAPTPLGGAPMLHGRCTHTVGSIRPPTTSMHRRTTSTRPPATSMHPYRRGTRPYRRKDGPIPWEGCTHPAGACIRPLRRVVPVGQIVRPMSIFGSGAANRRSSSECLFRGRRTKASPLRDNGVPSRFAFTGDVRPPERRNAKTMATKKENKATVVTSATQLIAGVTKRFATGTQVSFAGGSFTPAQITSKLQALVTLRTDVDTAKASTKAKLAAESADAPALRTFMSALVAYVKAVYGT